MYQVNHKKSTALDQEGPSSTQYGHMLEGFAVGAIHSGSIGVKSIQFSTWAVKCHTCQRILATIFSLPKKDNHIKY